MWRRRRLGVLTRQAATVGEKRGIRFHTMMWDGGGGGKDIDWFDAGTGVSKDRAEKKAL